MSIGRMDLKKRNLAEIGIAQGARL